MKPALAAPSAALFVLAAWGAAAVVVWLRLGVWLLRWWLQFENDTDRTDIHVLTTHVSNIYTYTHPFPPKKQHTHLYIPRRLRLGLRLRLRGLLQRRGQMLAEPKFLRARPVPLVRAAHVLVHL